MNQTRARFIIFGLLVGLFINFGFSQSSLAVSINSQELLDLTNNQRQQQALPTLILSDKLTEAAKLKAEDMLKNQYWAHSSQTGVDPWHWFDQVDYAYQLAGENLAKNYSTSEQAVEAWMNSPTHRDNLLNPKFTEIGFAIVEGKINSEPVKLVVALYGQPRAAVLGQAAVSPGSFELNPSTIMAASPLIGFAGLAAFSRSRRPFG